MKLSLLCTGPTVPAPGIALPGVQATSYTLAAEFAERILILREGRILADGPPDIALSEVHLAEAFNVRARIDRSGGAPRFSFQL
jgi:hypothetical protein